MKILFVLSYVPYPLNTGGNQATYNMLERIRKGHEVSVLFFIGSKSDKHNLERLKKIWDNITFYYCVSSYIKDVEKNNHPNTFSYRFYDSVRRSMERKLARRMRKFMINTLKNDSKNEYDFVHNNARINSSFKNIDSLPDDYLELLWSVSRQGFDVIQIEFFESLPLVYLLPDNVVKVYVQHEIHYVRNQNEIALFKNKTPRDVFRYCFLKDLEVKALERYNKIVALTEKDKEKMLKENKNLDIYVSPAAVSEPKEILDYKHPGTELVFIGAESHFPNLDGIVWFCQHVAPVLQEKGIKTTLYVIGNWRNKTKENILSESTKIIFTGYIDDLSSFINGKISIVPIRIGSGMRMKIMDSIFASSPIVTTSKGCEGLPMTNNEDCYIVDTANDFADAIKNLIENPKKQEKFTKNCLNKFRTSFNMKELQERRLQFYAQIENELKGKSNLEHLKT